MHAIGGDQSVTVTWCPPAIGQGDVTSYTVTSSDGTQVDAQVPNDYVIVDGLTNGHSYSFTVTANTTGTSGAASAASNAVTPAPIAGPKNVLLGKPQSVSYDQYSLMIGGKRTIIYAGEFDPWRTPSPSLWLDRLEKMKADGFNAVTPYFDWDYSSPAPGVYDFTGVRDINTFLNDAQKAGLYVIARPGPYINAETDAGGFPGWLVTQSGKARTDAPDYVAAAEQWLSEVDPIIAAHQITNGGDVILYQVENELFYNEPATVNYMADLIAKVKADGIDVPLTGNHSGTFNGATGVNGKTAAPDIDGYDSYPQGFNCADPSTVLKPRRLLAVRRRAADAAGVPGRVIRLVGRLGLRQLLRDDELGLRERLLQEQLRRRGHDPEQLHDGRGHQLGLAAGAVHVHLLRLRLGDPRVGRDRHAVGSERHRRLQVRREQAARRLPAVGSVARQDAGRRRADLEQLGGRDRGARQPR